MEPLSNKADPIGNFDKSTMEKLRVIKAAAGASTTRDTVADAEREVAIFGKSEMVMISFEVEFMDEAGEVNNN
jgi:hypothetical protein